VGFVDVGETHGGAFEVAGSVTGVFLEALGGFRSERGGWFGDG
jgi:hypothetical protein